MGLVRYYLNNPNGKKSTIIIATIHCFGDKHKISTKLSVNPEFWNKNKQVAKTTIEYPQGIQLNFELEKFSNRLNDALKYFSENDIHPTTHILKEELFKNESKNKQTNLNFWSLFDAFVLEKSAINVDVRNYNNSLRKQLKAGEKVYGAPLSFGALKLRADGFVQTWDNYLTFDAPNSDGDFGLSPNTIGKLHKDLKSFLNWCFDHGYAERFSLKHLPTIMMDVENVYLTEEELDALVELKLNGTDKTIRDLFIIGCETGMRFSDFTILSDAQLLKDHISYIPKKTSKKGVLNKAIVIPKSQRLLEVLKGYSAPPRFKDSVTVFNKTLRELCTKANINKPYFYEIERQNRREEISKAKYEMVTSHTARRTFCTLKFLKGMPAQAIMKFSGHTSERSFLKYLKLDAELTAEKFKGYF